MPAGRRGASSPPSSARQDQGVRSAGQPDRTTTEGSRCRIGAEADPRHGYRDLTARSARESFSDRRRARGLDEPASEKYPVKARAGENRIGPFPCELVGEPPWSPARMSWPSSVTLSSARAGVRLGRLLGRLDVRQARHAALGVAQQPFASASSPSAAPRRRPTRIRPGVSVEIRSLFAAQDGTSAIPCPRCFVIRAPTHP